MKFSLFRLFGGALLLVVGMQAYGGIYLIYGEATATAPLAVVDDQVDPVVFEEGYLSPRARAWINSSPRVASISPAIARPLAFNPPAVGYAVNGGTFVPLAVMAAPTATSSPELSRLIQSGHAWSAYQTGNNASGLGLVYSPSYGASLSPSQRSARGNRARAQAFRLDYYK